MPGNLFEIIEKIRHNHKKVVRTLGFIFYKKRYLLVITNKANKKLILDMGYNHSLADEFHKNMKTNERTIVINYLENTHPKSITLAKSVIAYYDIIIKTLPNDKTDSASADGWMG